MEYLFDLIDATHRFKEAVDNFERTTPEDYKICSGITDLQQCSIHVSKEFLVDAFKSQYIEKDDNYIWVTLCGVKLYALQ